MKLTPKVEKLKESLKKRKNAEQLEAPASGIAKWFTASAWVLAVLTVVVVSLASVAVWDSRAKVPRELVGLWEFNDGPQQRGTFEFFRDGTLEIQVQTSKKIATEKTRVAVKGKALFITANNSRTARDSKVQNSLRKALFVKGNEGRTTEGFKSESTIRELTADTLVLEVESEVLRMVRIE